MSVHIRPGSTVCFYTYSADKDLFFLLFSAIGGHFFTKKGNNFVAKNCKISLWTIFSGRKKVGFILPILSVSYSSYNDLFVEKNWEILCSVFLALFPNRKFTACFLLAKARNVGGFLYQHCTLVNNVNKYMQQMTKVDARWIKTFACNKLANLQSREYILYIRKFSPGLYFHETLYMRRFVKIKPLRNGKITLSFIDIGKSCLSREFFTSLICLLMLFAQI